MHNVQAHEITFAHPPSSQKVAQTAAITYTCPTLSHLSATFQAAHDYSQNYIRFAAINAVEMLAGRGALRRLYHQAAADMQAVPGLTPFQAGLGALAVNYAIKGGDIAAIPAQGALVVVSNHPYGIVDGLILGDVLHRARRDFKLVGSDLFARAPELAPWLLPVDTSGSPEGEKKNRKNLLGGFRFLNEGHAVGIFPSGKVSRPDNWNGFVQDYDWNAYAGRLLLNARKTGIPASFLPIHFEGCNSAWYQLAYLMRSTVLRRGMLISETLGKRGATISVNIGTPIDARDLPSDIDRLVDIMRAETYALRRTQSKSCWPWAAPR